MKIQMNSYIHGIFDLQLPVKPTFITQTISTYATKNKELSFSS